MLLVAGALTTFLPNNKDDKVLELRREVRAQGRPVREAFTLIMQTHNRTDLLLRLLNHYQALPRLHRAIVVWNNVGEKAPEDVWDSLGPHPVPVVFKPQTTNRMRNRLQAFPELETEGELPLGARPGLLLVFIVQTRAGKGSHKKARGKAEGTVSHTSGSSLLGRKAGARCTARSVDVVEEAGL